MEIGDRIKLKMDLPINERCGATAGSIFIVTRLQKLNKKLKRATQGLGPLVYFDGADGSECGAYEHEYEEM